MGKLLRRLPLRKVIYKRCKGPLFTTNDSKQSYSQSFLKAIHITKTSSIVYGTMFFPVSLK